MTKTFDRVWALRRRVQHSTIRFTYTGHDFIFDFGSRETWTVRLTGKQTLREVIHITHPFEEGYEGYCREETSLKALEAAVSKRLEF